MAWTCWTSFLGIICFLMDALLGCDVKQFNSGSDTEQFDFRRTIPNTNSAEVYQVLYINGTNYEIAVISATFHQGKLVGVPQFREDITLTGNISEGDFSFKLLGVSVAKAGVYEFRKNRYSCIGLYVLGKPTKPYLANNSIPDEGDDMNLTCSSISTTVPDDHGLNLTFSWYIHGQQIPLNNRFGYFGNRLRISNVQRTDRNKTFTCTAKEDVFGGLKSDTSNQLRMNVYYGPDSVTLSPSQAVHTVNETDRLDFIVCTAECYPICTYVWRKENQQVTDERTLQLGSNINRSKAGKYTCTAANPYRNGSPSAEAAVSIFINYGPDNAILQPQSKFYTKNELQTLNNISCTADCYPKCTIKWMKDNYIYQNNNVLSLGELTEMHAGNYTCIATNTKKQGTAEEIVTINVRYGPKNISFTPAVTGPIIKVEDEYQQQITCSSKCYPSCTASWNTTKSTQAILSLGNVTRFDAGYYKCISSNAAPQYRKEMDRGLQLVVHYGPENVILSPPATEYIKREGEILHTITCVSDCYPGCTYIWNNGSADVSLTNTLSLGRLHRMDAATYFCLARNYETGVTRERNLTLHILHSPRPVAGTNSVITATPGTTVVLSLTVIAYPVPMEYFWYKRVINDWIELYNFATVTKERTSLQFNLTISSFKKEDYGEYKLTVDNGVGNHMTYVFTVKTPGDETEAEGDEIETGNDTQDNTGLLVLSVSLGALLVIILLTIGVIASKRFLFRKGRMVRGRYKDGNISAGSGTDDVQMSTFEGTNASTVSRDGDAKNDHVYDEVKRRASPEHAYGQLGSNTGSTPKTYENFF